MAGERPHQQVERQFGPTRIRFTTRERTAPHPDWRAEWQFARQHGFSQAAWAEMIGTTPEYAKLLVKGKRTGTRPLTHEREAYDVEIRSGPQAGRVRHIPARKLKGSIAQRYGRLTAEQDLWRATWRDTQRRYHRVVFRVVPGYDGRWLVRMTITAMPMTAITITATSTCAPPICTSWPMRQPPCSPS